jgi:hypothetical protein
MAVLVARAAVVNRGKRRNDDGDDGDDGDDDALGSNKTAVDAGG